MKRILIPLLLFACQHSSTLGQPASSNQLSLHEMQATLAAQDIDAFLSGASKEGWNPPPIYSHWHIENVATNAERPTMEAAREFGKAVAIKIAADTQRLPFPQTTAEARRFSNSYLDLADWLNKSEGYGNIILGSRCLDIAAVGVGCCVLDPAFPEKDLSRLLSRLRPRWLEPQARKEILNEEAGTPLFSVGENHGESNLVETINRIWQTGQTQVLEKRNPSLKAIRIKQQEERSASAKTQKNQPAPEVSYFDRPEILANLPFFTDDSLSGSTATVAMWDKKQHGQVVAALESANVAKVEALAKFREKVGGFPTNFVVKHPFYTGGKAAFDLAWRPHATEKTRLLSVTAWQAYDELKHGTFLDQETKLCRAAQSDGIKP